MQNEELLKQYAELDIEYQRLADKRELLRGEILKAMIRDNSQTVKTDFATFSVSKRISYKYSEKITDLENKVKVAKMKEERSGKAERIEKDQLQVRIKDGTVA